MKQIALQYFKCILPVLFITYFGCITLCAHIHVGEDYIIVHSHPFSDSPDKSPHTHDSKEEIIFFHTISSLDIADGAIHPLILDGYIPNQFVSIFSAFSVLIPICILGHLSLRAPPIG